MKTIIFIFTVFIIYGFSIVKWIDYQNNDCHFKIKFPIQPKESNSNVINPNNKSTIINYSFDCSMEELQDENLYYSVSYMEFPYTPEYNFTRKEIIDNVFENSIKGMVDSTRGKLVDKKVIFLQKHQGRQIKIEIKKTGVIINAKIYIAFNRYYMIFVGSLKNKDSNLSIDKFLNSFKILE